MKTFDLLLAVLVSVTSSALLPAQEAPLYERGTTYLENTMPPSPEPASIVKYADVPFSHSLGLAEYDIPIYTLEGKELDLPVSLHYASGGIKLDEIAGVAGLGWRLEAGGTITRTVNDMPDEFYSARLHHEMPSGTLLSDLESMNETTATMNYLRDLMWHRIDSSLDRYDYNVCGLSGSFVIQDNGSIFQLAGDGVLINYTRASDDSVDSFTITGTDGTVYIFSVKETAVHEGRGETVFTPTTGEPDRWSATTAWHLSQMCSRSGLETAEFTYSNPVTWDRDVYVTRQTCNITAPYSGGVTPDYGRSSTYISCSYQTRYLTGISLGGTNMTLSYSYGTGSTRHTGRPISARNCPAALTCISVTADGNPEELLRMDVGTSSSMNDGRIILKSLRLYCSDVLEDKWDFGYNELDHTVSYASQDWYGYYNGENEYTDSGTTNACPFEMSAHIGGIDLVSGYPAPEHADYMSLSYVLHDGVRINYSYEANTITRADTDYHVGVRVKSIIIPKGLLANHARYFTYENPAATGPLHASVDYYLTTKGTTRASGLVALCDWEYYLNEYPVAIGPSIRETRILYGKVTEDVADRLILFIGNNAPSGNTARTVYTYSTSGTSPNTHSTSNRFPSKWNTFYDSHAPSFCSPRSGIRTSYADSGPTGTALLTRKEVYSYEEGAYRLVSSSDYTYDSDSGTYVLVDYHAVQVMYHELYGKVNYEDVFHYPIYASSSSGRNPTKEVHVEYHLSGNDTTTVNISYVSRSNLSVPVRVAEVSMSEMGVTRRKSYIYADTWPQPNSIMNTLMADHYLSRPVKEEYRIDHASSSDLQSYLLKEEIIGFEHINIAGNSYLLPKNHVEKTLGNESWSETILSRDGFGNISSFKEKGMPETVVLWGYGGNLPVAVIRNSSYAAVSGLFDNASDIDLFASATVPSQEYISFLSSIRQRLPSAHVTVYTHIPGVGMSSATDPAGMVTTYEYDSAGRLSCIRDNDGNKVEEHTYSFMNDSDNRRHRRSKVFLSSDGQKYAEDVSWWDQLGQKTQDISIAAAGNGADLITAYTSDFLLHDDVKVWLPYPVQNTGGVFQSNAEESSAAYHGNDYAYLNKEYELSSRDRVLTTALPGFDGSHEAKSETDIAEGFPMLEWNNGAISTKGTYASGCVFVEKRTDADGRIVSTFHDHAGRLLGSSKGTSEPTYHIYDKHDRLRAVVGSGTAFSDTLNMWRYSYDNIGRLSSKGIPGSVREFYTYDDEDRVASVEKNGIVRQMEYDPFNRLTYVYVTDAGGTEMQYESHTYDTATSGANAKGLLTHSRLALIGPDGEMTGYADSYYSYDEKKRPVMIRTNYTGGLRLTEEFTYTFNGEVSSSSHRFLHNSAEDRLLLNYEYDSRGRLHKETAILRTAQGPEKEAVVNYSYDALGRPYRTTVSVPSGCLMVSSSSFTLQGWKSAHNVSLNGSVLFSQTLGYDQSVMISGMPKQYSGLLTRKDERWQATGSTTTTKTEYYSYDYAGRLSRDSSGNSNTSYTYDQRGNILSATGTSSRARYTYSGNRLQSMLSVTGNTQRTFSFAHDALGRMTNDGLSGVTMTYNPLDLIGKVRQNGTTLVNYSYLADGTKTRAENGNGTGLFYVGPFVYRSAGSSLTFESAAFGGGRLTADRALLYVKDYLGSIRAVADGWSGQFYKVSDYSSYGEESGVAVMPTVSVPAGITLRDSYTGKEDQGPDFGLGYIDFGARQYSPAMRCWMTPDPLSEQNYGNSPYAFCNGDPVNFVDRDGKFPDFIWDLASIGYGVRNMVGNIRSGNVKAAVGDGLGIVVDVVAAAVPVVPGGVGIVKSGAKALNFADAGIDMVRLNGELNMFEHAGEFGVNSYKKLRKDLVQKHGTYSGLEVHHLIEKRFAGLMELKHADIPSIVLTKDEHRKLTNAWRDKIGYSKSSKKLDPSNTNKETILDAARAIYEDYPETLKIIEEVFK